MVKKQNFLYMDTDKFTVYINTNDIYKKNLQKILKQNLTPRILNRTDHYRKERPTNLSV